MKISKRKFEHIQVVLEKDIQFRKKTTGFEDYDFIHCALPEIDYTDIHTQTEFFQKTLSFPLLISAMTGGYNGALNINRQLAEICQSEKLALGVGSQRQLIESNDFNDSYRIVRKMAPDSIIIGNIGAAQLTEFKNYAPIRNIIDIIEADAMAVHLNPLQEILQPEGDGHFRGVLRRIEQLVKTIEIPVIVKEVGCGISGDVAKKLVQAGVSYIDIAGAGGTSWAGIEFYRSHENSLAQTFWDWGIPTALSLKMVSRIPGAKIIASGGIEDGVMMAKALALGADLCGAALPFLRVLMEKGTDGLVSVIHQWREALKMVMFLTGSLTIKQLHRKGILRKTL